MKKIFLIGLSSALITLLFSFLFSGLFKSWELKTLDLRFALRGGTDTSSSLVMIDADDASAAIYGVWPWDRSVHAEILQFLKEADAAVIAYDILFSHPGDPVQDSLLQDTSQTMENVVYPVAISLSETGSQQRKESAGAADLWPNHLATDAVQHLFSTEEVIFPLPGLRRKEGLGHIATNRDLDGIVRRVPLIVRHRDKILPSLAFQTVLNFLKVSPADVQFTGSSLVISGAALPGKTKTEDIMIPVDRQGQMLINFAGQWGNTFKHASFASVISSEPDETGGNGEELQGKIILIANTLSGSDMKSIPLEKNFPGPGIHANIINTILTRNFLRETTFPFQQAVVLLLSLATARILASRKYIQKMAAVFLLAAGYIALTVVMFNAGVVFGIVLPIMAIFIAGFSISIYQSTVEKKNAESLLLEKQKVETRIKGISRELGEKENELKQTLIQLNELQEGLEKEKRAEDVRSQRIHEIQAKLTEVTRQKMKLHEEHDELVKRFDDLNIDSSGEEGSLPDDLESIQEECIEAGIVTQNRQVLETFRILKQYAPVPSPVLILGESGTGKELFARALHNMSQRKNKPFIPVNMGAIPKELIESELFGHMKGAFTGAVNNKKGKFSLADQGTIFLDEIGDTALDAQVKLLRVLQEKEVQPVGGEAYKIDTRVVAATHQRLEGLIKNGQFREDLFYRLNALTIHLPPLRERKEDIPYLVQYFVNKYTQAYGKSIQGVSEQAMKKILHHEWKGNIRELENVIQRGITLAQGDLVQEKDLGLVASQITATKTAVENKGKSKRGVDDESLLNFLRENKFEINETAEQLNMSRNTVASRFKGICFDLLVKMDLDHENVAQEISDNEQHQELVRQKIVEYHENLIKTVNGFNDKNEAIKEILKRSKNIPSQYHPAIRELVKRSYLQRDS